MLYEDSYMHHLSDQLLKAEYLVLLDQIHSYMRGKKTS